jgi:hypothetical protein
VIFEGVQKRYFNIKVEKGRGKTKKGEKVIVPKIIVRDENPGIITFAM